MSEVRLRFAPSPTGRLHIGNARTALFNWLFARGQGGTFLLRIEDTDRERSRPDYEEEILQDLRWLGLVWGEGVGAGGAYGPYRQSERGEEYGRAARRLLRERKAYPCFCSPQELEEDRRRALSRGKAPRYSGRCRHLSPAEVRRRREAGDRPVIRLRVEEREAVSFSDLLRGSIRIPAEQIGDPILLRSDGGAGYNFAAVVDDSAMRISHVIRGEDHLSNTARQVLLYRALGKEPPKFLHLPLVLGEDGKPLAKRDGDLSIKGLRSGGYLPAALTNYLALLGWSPPAGREVLELEEMAGLFRLESLSRSPSLFDRQKLDWVNAQHLRRLDPDAIGRMAAAALGERGYLPEQGGEEARRWPARLAALFRDHLVRPGDLAAEADLLFDFPSSERDLRVEVREVLRQEGVLDLLRVAAVRFGSLGCPDEATCRGILRDLERETGRRGRPLLRPLRAALTGRLSGPELVRLVPAIEQGSRLRFGRPIPGCRRRIERMVRFLSGEG